MTYEETLARIAEENSNLVVMTAENRAAIRGLPPRIGPRFIDVGIAEQTLVGAAAGLALRGRTPVVHALAAFLVLRAFEFIRTDVGLAGLPVKLVGGVPGFLSEANGPTHQAIEDIALMRGIPSMQVYCPADEADLVACLPAIIESPHPAYVRFNASKPAVADHAPFEIGRAELFGDGRTIAILTYGVLLEQALLAKRILDGNGLGTTVAHMRTLKPIDEEAIANLATSSPLVVTLEDHFETGGLFTIVAEVLQRRRITACVVPFALPSRWFRPALLLGVLDHEGFTGQKIAARIQRELGHV